MKNLLLFFFFPFVLSAQIEPDLSKNFGAGGAEQFNKVIETGNGLVVAVGQTTSNTVGGADGYFVVWNPTTNETIVEKAIGFAKDETINTLVQTYDGFFLLAGSTTSKGQGKKDAWVLLVDEKGQVLWDTTFGTAGDDEFLHFTLLGDGSPVLCGTKNDKKEGDVWILGLDRQSIAWEKVLGKKEYYSVGGIVRNYNGQLVLTGTTDKAHPNRENNIWLFETTPDASPKTKAYPTYGEDKTYEEATGLITTADNGYVIVGSTDQRGTTEMLLLKYDLNGRRTSQPIVHGERNSSVANCVFQDPATGSFYFAGETKNYLAAARFNLGYFVKHTPGKDLENSAFGGQLGNNSMRSAIMLHDGRLLFAGYTESRSRGARDAWVCLFQNPNLGIPFGGSRSKESWKELNLSPPIVQSADGQLKPGEKTYLKFTVTAPLNEAIPDAQVRITPEFGFENIVLETTHYLGYLKPGENRELRIPIRAGKDIKNSENEFGISLYSGDVPIKDFPLKKFISRPFLPDRIEVGTEPRWQKDQNFDDESISINIANPGDAPAKNVQVIFTPGEGIVSLGNTSFNYLEIGQHTNQLVVYKFKKTPGFKGQVRIGCQIRKNNVVVYEKTLENSTQLASGSVMELYELDGRTLRKIPERTIDHTDYLLKLTFQYRSNVPVKKDQFKVLVNNREVSGTKMDEKKLGPIQKEGDMISGPLDILMTLDKIGKNEIKVEYYDDAGQLLGEYKQIVNYQMGPVNLHLISIGIKSDLRYTQKDARVFAESFKGQEGKLYKNVFIDTLAKDNLSQSEIRETFTELIERAQNKDHPKHIRETDVLMVFISSHGKNSPNSNGFIIPLTNYLDGYEETRAIAFEKDILAKLNKVNCKTKLILIDACHSGSAKDFSDTDRAEALGKLLSAQPGLSTLASCQEKELSYEHPNWGHGAFTKGILEAFSNTIIPDAQGDYSADADRNGSITLQELYQFLRRRVPQMVRTDYDPGKNQTPILPRDELEKEKVTLFVRN